MTFGEADDYTLSEIDQFYDRAVAYRKLENEAAERAQKRRP